MIVKRVLFTSNFPSNRRIFQWLNHLGEVDSTVLSRNDHTLSLFSNTALACVEAGLIEVAIRESRKIV